MRNVLIISFDLIRPHEIKQSFSIASLLSFLKNDKRYGTEFIVHHLPINMFEQPRLESINSLSGFLNAFNLEFFDTIAISCYIWSEHIINKLIEDIRRRGFNQKIVLGGYQISYPSKPMLKSRYKDCDIFIFGYAEKSLLEAIFMEKPKGGPKFLNSDPDFNKIPSPYLSNELVVSTGQNKIRIETKRGCPYLCSFCSHRNISRNKVHEYNKNRVFRELALLKEKQVKKINVIDPTFNYGCNYLEILQEMIGLELNALVSFQARFELIRGRSGKAFLDLVGQLNSHLEFGVQSLIEKEFTAVNRPNKIEIIRKVIRQLKERNQSFEISLIYGLPNQTIDSFKQSIDFLYFNGCKKITAYPLMLLRGALDPFYWTA